ncbi:MAG: sigma-E processing peptidase SpoIIGA [Firmicutes bacterium]|nr:sigma-E processing peptidase SpoIIGA [Bacillota bacterium]
MTLYADMLFLVNFLMNTFVLWVVSKITRNKKKTRWLFAGAGIMSLLYTLLIAVEHLQSMNVALSSVGILTLGILVTFRLTSAREFIKLMIVAYIISFTVGGLGMALFFLTDIPYAVHFIANDRQGFAQAISWQLALAGMAASYVLIKLGLKMAAHHTLKRQMLCNVQIFMDDKGASFNALVDTGHSLTEPLSQSPVIIAEFEHVKDFLPDGLKVLFYEKNENDLTELLQEQESTFYKRIRMIPFTSIGRTNGMLIGFRPDRVAVEGAKETTANVIIGIYNDKLCRDGRYQGLLSPELAGGSQLC